MTALKNHPNYWLREDAAKSFDRMEDERGRPFSISDAGRTVAQQQILVDRWNAGGMYNRPPYLYQPASPSVSPHVINGGAAVDVDNSNDRAWIQANGRKHGWRFNIPSDVVHMIYESQNDQFRITSGSSPVYVPSVPTSIKWNGIQEMLRAIYGYKGAIDNVPGPGTVSAFQRFLKSNGYNPGPVDGLWGPNTGMAGQRWLRARWGYSGQIDNDYGPLTRAAWAKAEAANAAAY